MWKWEAYLLKIKNNQVNHTIIKFNFTITQSSKITQPYFILCLKNDKILHIPLYSCLAEFVIFRDILRNCNCYVDRRRCLLGHTYDIMSLVFQQNVDISTIITRNIVCATYSSMKLLRFLNYTNIFVLIHFIRQTLVMQQMICDTVLSELRSLKSEL